MIVYITDPVEVIFNWNAEGDVQGYMLYMTNSLEQRKDLDKTTANMLTMDLSTLPADTYVLHVGAVPVGAQSEADVVWGTITFVISPAE